MNRNITFGDAENAEDIPLRYAALYASDTDYPCPPSVAARWDDAHKHWITFGGLRSCQIADFEPGTEVFADTRRLLTWAVIREHKEQRSIIYSDLSNVHLALSALSNVNADFWLAYPTGDDKPLTQEQLSRILADQFNTQLSVSRIWAHQYYWGDTYDKSCAFESW